MARHIPCQGIEEEGRERVRELKATKVGGGGGGGRERVAREEGGGKKGGVAYYRYTRRAKATLTTLTADGGIASPFGVVSCGSSEGKEEEEGPSSSSSSPLSFNSQVILPKKVT